MALFKLSALDGSVELIVRAVCLSCARTVAVMESQAKETLLWRDPSLSYVSVIYDTHKLPYEPTGKRGLLERIENDK